MQKEGEIRDDINMHQKSKKNNKAFRRKHRGISSGPWGKQIFSKIEQK